MREGGCDKGYNARDMRRRLFTILSAATLVFAYITSGCAASRSSFPPGSGAAPVAAVAVEPTGAQIQTRSALRHTVNDLALSSTSLDDCLDRLADECHVSIVVRWDRLQATDVERDKPITARLHGLSGEVALRVIMYLAGHDLVREANYVREGGISTGVPSGFGGRWAQGPCAATSALIPADPRITYIPTVDRVTYYIDRNGQVIISSGASSTHKSF
jgi:hypothetical protein